jgi:hypothetical protein
VPGTRHWEFHFDKLNTSIPDFVAIKKKLVIELDDSQHFEQEEFDIEGILRAIDFILKEERITRILPGAGGLDGQIALRHQMNCICFDGTNHLR